MRSAELFNVAAKGPSGGQAYWLTASDEVQLRVAAWSAKDARGTVFLLPGRSDYVEQYGIFASCVHLRGYSTLAIDWRGQGCSDRLASNTRIGHVDGFEDYQKDVNALIDFATQADMPKPWFMVAHSMGGCIALRALTNGIPMTAVAFTAPMWKIRLSPVLDKIALPLAGLLQTCGAGLRYVPGGSEGSYVEKHDFASNDLTNDPEMYNYWSDLARQLPNLQIGSPSIRWLYEALTETRRLSKMPSPNIPCKAYWGKEDVTVTGHDIERRIKEWPDGHFNILPAAKHELLMEVVDVREHIVNDMIDFFEKSSC